MNGADILCALHLPDSARVDQRVPKKLLLENSAPAASDKRLIADAIEGIQWIAALKPHTVGVSDYRDTQREYLEIAIITMALRSTTGPTQRLRLAELIHRAVPYPVFLLQDDGQTLGLSLANKRWSQNESGKVVLDGDLTTASTSLEASNPASADANACGKIEHDFLRSLPITNQPRTNLLTLYQGWMGCVLALRVAQRTGNYRTTARPEETQARQQILMGCERLEGEISHLRAQAVRETQLARQVELNLSIQRMQAELADTQQQL